LEYKLLPLLRCEGAGGLASFGYCRQRQRERCGRQKPTTRKSGIAHVALSFTSSSLDVDSREPASARKTGRPALSLTALACLRSMIIGLLAISNASAVSPSPRDVTE